MLVGWHKMVIRVLRMRRNSPSTCFITSAKPTSLPIMCHSTLCDGTPFKFHSGQVSRETIAPWDHCNVSCAQVDSTIPYTSNTEVKLILFYFLTSRN